MSLSKVIIISGEIYAFLSIIAYVASSAMFRRIETKVSPSQINAFRTIFGALSFIVIGFFLSLYGNITMYSMSLIALLLVSIIFGQVIGDTSYFHSQERMGTTITLAITTTFPFFTFILSIVFLDANIPLEFFISGLLIAMGVLVITFLQDTTEEEETTTKIQLVPVIYAFVASFGWAVAVVLTDLTFNDIGDISGDGTATLTGNLIRFPFAALILMMMAYRSPSTKVTEWESGTWTWLLIASVIGTSLGVYLYSEAIRLAGASFVSLIGTSSPLVAIPIAWLINGEKISKKSLIGIVFILGGVILIL
ncbi:MAG: DMT family transporter [Candidatus Heimdallarchaeota archaeon]|nr:DMT family transporter [Candidatus Heimdallarchaeota archaeon]MCK5048287.1 DMT family transporter [Candidatus Heimdallarchaeota archaeon]